MQRKEDSRDQTLKSVLLTYAYLVFGKETELDGWRHLSLQNYSEDRR